MGKGTCHQPLWWKERTRSYRLFSDFHMYAVGHMCAHTHTSMHACKHKIKFKNNNLAPNLFSSPTAQLPALMAVLNWLLQE